MYNIDDNCLVKCLFDFHAVFSNSDRGRHVVEEKLQQSKVKSEKFLIVKFVLITGHFFI